MRVARADGVLLKPDRPALAIDSQWYGDIFHAGPLQSETGEISETVSLTQSHTQTDRTEQNRAERC